MPNLGIPRSYPRGMVRPPLLVLLGLSTAARAVSIDRLGARPASHSVTPYGYASRAHPASLDLALCSRVSYCLHHGLRTSLTLYRHSSDKAVRMTRVVVLSRSSSTRWRRRRRPQLLARRRDTGIARAHVARRSVGERRRSATAPAPVGKASRPQPRRPRAAQCLAEPIGLGAQRAGGRGAVRRAPRSPRAGGLR